MSCSTSSARWCLMGGWILDDKSSSREGFFIAALLFSAKDENDTPSPSHSKGKLTGQAATAHRHFPDTPPQGEGAPESLRGGSYPVLYGCISELRVRAANKKRPGSNPARTRILKMHYLLEETKSIRRPAPARSQSSLRQKRSTHPRPPARHPSWSTISGFRVHTSSHTSVSHSPVPGTWVFLFRCNNSLVQL